jgi:tellurite resistance protein TerC
VLLGFIGFKLVFHAMHENELAFINGGEHIEWAPEIPTLLSLGIIVSILTITTVASLVVSKRRAQVLDVPDEAPHPR